MCVWEGDFLGESCRSVVEKERSLPFPSNQVIRDLRDHLENITDIIDWC